MDQEVIDYIRQARSHGLIDGEIKQNLLNSGWDASVVEEAFGHAKAKENQLPQNRDEDINIQKQHVAIGVQTNDLPEMHLGVADPHNLLGQEKSRRIFGKALLFGLVAVAVLAAGAWGYYTYVYASPTRVWENFVSSGGEKIYQKQFSFSYADAGSLDEQVSEDFELKDIKLSFEGTSYTDTENSEDPQSSSDLLYTFSSGNTSFSTGFKYALLNRTLYINIGENPFLRGLMQSVGGSGDAEWVKLDLSSITQGSNATSDEYSKKLQEVFSPTLRDELKEMWDGSRFVKIESFEGREKIGDIQTLHFKNSIDKEALKSLLVASIVKINEAAVHSGQEVKEADVQTLKEVVEALIDKVEVKNFETWVGIKDFRLYQVRFVSNAPSFISLVKSPLLEAREKSRDAKRLADVRQLGAALELYYNDHGGYPEGKDGIPQELSPYYIGLFPTAPMPSDGGCTDYFNSYWYTASGSSSSQAGKNTHSSYELSFCLGQATAGYAGGIAKLTPAGIQANIPCPSTAENCGTAGTNQDTTMLKERGEEIVDYVRNLEYSAEFNLEANYLEYGVKKSVEAPREAFDLNQILKSSMQNTLGPKTEE